MIRGIRRVLAIWMAVTGIFMACSDTLPVNQNHSTQTFSPDMGYLHDERANRGLERKIEAQAKITFYCKEAYAHICNDGDASHTALGTAPTIGRTCSVDTSKIPLGSRIEIDGHTYIAEDSFGNHTGEYRVDILVDTHGEALKLGTYHTMIAIYPTE